MARYTFVPSEKVYTHNVVFTKKELNKLLTSENVSLSLLEELMEKFVRKSNRFSDRYHQLSEIDDDLADEYAEHTDEIVYNASNAKILDEYGNNFKVDFLSQRSDNMTVISKLNGHTYVLDIVLDGNERDEKATIEYIKAYDSSENWPKKQWIRGRDNITDEVPGLIALRTMQFFIEWYQMERADVAPDGEVVFADNRVKFAQALHSYDLYGGGTMHLKCDTEELYETFGVEYSYDPYDDEFFISDINPEDIDDEWYDNKFGPDPTDPDSWIED